MSQIKQFFISKSVEFFTSRLESNYKIKCVNNSIYNDNEPCAFFGIYRMEDYIRINNHKGFKLVIPCGCDARPENHQAILGIDKSAKFISISHWISREFDSLVIPYKFLPVCFEYIDYFKPTLLGNKVYAYTPNENFGKIATETLAKEMDYEFVIKNDCREHSLSELRDIYNECFVCLRLRDWYDGNSATSVGCALMGRKSVWNGDGQHTIHYPLIDGKPDLEYIKKLIIKEAKKIGSVQEEVAKTCYDYFNIGKEWLKEEYYLKKEVK